MSAAPTVRREPPAILTMAFRPFFLAASLWAMFGLTISTAMMLCGLHVPSRFDALTWHIHEMLFGFVFAAIAGFLLTAISRWTGRPPIQGIPLAGLVIVWLLGRIACLVSTFIPIWIAAGIDLAFPVALCAVTAREIIASRNWRNLPIPMAIAALGVADLLMYLELDGFSVPTGLGWRLGLAAIIALISVIGGRIIPNFTRGWLAKHGELKVPGSHGIIDRTASGALHAGLTGWAFFPTSKLIAVLLLIAAVLNLMRLARWRGTSTLREPLLAILHVGYLWIIAGVTLLGTAILTRSVPTMAAIHALTAGAIGTMVLAVMTRVTLGHTGRPLQADRIAKMIYVAINLAAATRIAAAFIPVSSTMLLCVSAVLWVISFGLFAAFYGPILCQAVVPVREPPTAHQNHLGSEDSVVHHT